MQHSFKPQLGLSKLSTPHVVNEDKELNTVGVIVDADYEMTSGDEVGSFLQNGVFIKDYTITEIIERRKAKGNWEGCSFPHPDFVKFKRNK